mmetsp:Transcript_40473/g.49089  ORF Transcript_40473/g.49089 Transcript_40473/m.49089 type:complete len:137 (-) Transcript_40473:607-1017(-)|eukprot:CAMPEP_0197860840 /NCGR_PEP_ID=MMETSP1438-20131217/36487_1 /TAXON_ID=1461541 /ORGANISM="Pterosperma sp., Strain CCMP1384" /LENGTH=136 /DNA_ID=CAMNT_0043477833 /DNA_START=402 /DNA_END=815 /DNA_ORIENTATION=-
MSSIYSLYIVNKSGGLIYQKDFADIARADTNEAMTLASIWHSLHTISAQLSPHTDSGGIELLEADTFNLHCYQSPTGTKFFMICAPRTMGMDSTLKNIYNLYADYVLKNPFYEMEMPIRCSQFDAKLIENVRGTPL